MLVRSPTLRHRVTAFVAALLAGGCVGDFPERAEAVSDARAEGLDASDAADRLPAPDAAPAPDVAPVPDAPATVAPPPDAAVLPPDAAVTRSEVCNGLDDDENGEVDDGADADCLRRYIGRPICLEGVCKVCVEGTNQGCPTGFTCLGEEENNLCAQCTPQDNHCPGDAPYCSPMDLVCIPCPERALYGHNQVAQRCRDDHFDGHCEFLFRTPAGTVNTCENLCLAVGMRCARAFSEDDDVVENPSDGPVCRPGLEAECTSTRQGNLVCDCTQ